MQEKKICGTKSLKFNKISLLAEPWLQILVHVQDVISLLVAKNVVPVEKLLTAVEYVRQRIGRAIGKSVQDICGKWEWRI